MISDSISSGAAARQPVEMVMDGRSMSGVIWIGSLTRLSNPKITRRMQPTATATGLFNPAFVSCIEHSRPTANIKDATLTCCHRLRVNDKCEDRTIARPESAHRFIMVHDASISATVGPPDQAKGGVRETFAPFAKGPAQALRRIDGTHSSCSSL